MQIISLNTKKSNQKGFILFAVVGILAIVGILFLLLQSRSVQQNIDAHRLFYAETSRTTAESILELFVHGFRNSIESTPSQKDWINKGVNSYFSFFLRDPLLLGTNGTGIIRHKQNISFLASDTLAAIKSLAQEIDLKSYELTLSYVCKYRQNENETIFDALQSYCQLQFQASVDYRGSQKSATSLRKFFIYPLNIPYLSRFTLYHAKDNLESYQKLYTDSNGQPIQNNGSFKYPYNFPLVLYHSPDDSPDIQTDQELYGKAKLGPESLDHLTTEESFALLRNSLEKRGWLYLGGPGPTFLQMTPGYGPLGEQFLIENINIYTAKAENSNSVSVTKYLMQDLPEGLKQEVPLIYQYLDPFLNNGQEHYGSFGNICFYNGFYESDSASDPRFYISNYSAGASLLHVFGSMAYPSRTYTVSQAYLNIARLCNLSLDRDSTNADESSLEACTGNPATIYDSSTKLGYLSEDEYLSKNLPFYQDPPMLWANNSANFGCNEPIAMQTTNQLDWHKLLSSYTDYETIMSKNIRVNLNDLIDFVHFSHRTFPPDIHPDFKKYHFRRFFPNKDGVEEWPRTEPKALYKNDRSYVFGHVSDSQIDWLAKARASYWYKDQNELIEKGVLKKGANKFYLDTKGKTIGLKSDLNLNLPIEALNDASIEVLGNCFLPPIKSNKFYVGFSCQNIYLVSPLSSDSNQLSVYEAQLFAKQKLLKNEPTKPILIFGSVYVDSFDLSLFSSSSSIIYNPELNPLSKEHYLYYRMALDDHSIMDSKL